MSDNFRREREILERAYREVMGYQDYPCDHGNRDVICGDDGVVRIYCLDCRMTAWSSFEDAQYLGWLEEPW